MNANLNKGINSYVVIFANSINKVYCSSPEFKPEPSYIQVGDNNHSAIPPPNK